MTDDAPSGPLADREWRLIPEERRDGAMQMALDEIAAETAADGGPRTVRVYRWEPSTLSLGYHQDPETVDWERCERENVTVTRRQTGGGGIYHDYDGDISYSIVAPKAELPGDLMESYHLLCEPILDAFARLGVAADFVEESMPEIWHPACYLRELHPAHDVVANGKKISGNAQYRRNDAVIQHGSLTYSVTEAAHLDVFAGHDVTDSTFETRVGGIDEFADVTREEAVSAVESALADWADATVGEWTADELERARERAEEKYADDKWVRRDPRS
ncbi:lipoate--protein ligase family protein [Halogeometricum borinquense]|uniref:Lipoate--protein ligase family protein n=1 Tax=Halogeometricum borinquense TaxID=60847 RepID=A0A6C0UHF1_9EURY|nr:biotin/lipoate A/B protein ligase family protein [Halogeometricum borinquense]QIB73229.1 lipoate--protein ligase family protein [Halogeometricum borinquense]QIQ77375.1 lipoate--protein ligase family protein [Halogeometricum borinquense]